MSRRWIRFYTEIPDDPKVQSLPDKTFKFWVNCLCLAGRAEGMLPDPASIAWSLRQDQRQVEKMILHLVENGLLETEGNGFKPHNWHNRQYDHDVSSERVKRYRERQRNVSCNVPSGHDETIGNVTETSSEQNRTEQNRTDSLFVDSADAEPKPQKPKSRRKSPTHDMKETSLPDEWGSYAISKYGWTIQKCRDEFDRFSNHHKARGTMFSNWKAAWYTWCSNDGKFSGGSKSIERPTIPDWPKLELPKPPADWDPNATF